MTATTPGQTTNYNLPTVQDENGDVGAALLALLKEGTLLIDAKIHANAQALLTKANKPTKETVTLAVASWQQLSTAVGNYKYKATATLQATIPTNCTIELINNNLASFAKYGFGIATIDGQVVTFYALDKPSDDVALIVEITEG